MGCAVGGESIVGDPGAFAMRRFRLASMKLRAIADSQEVTMWPRGAASNDS